MALVTPSQRRTAYEKALKSINDCNRYDANTRIHYPKVCTLCDRFIMKNQEAKLRIDDLKEDVIRNNLGKTAQEKKYGHFLNTKAFPHYTQQVIKKNKILNDLLLSRRTYLTFNSNHEQCFGCCKSCHSYFHKYRTFQIREMPKYFIANGLAIGTAPKVLTDLNEVELAMISINRVDKHIFSFYGGSHRQIRGWHSMYYSDLSATSGVVNFMATDRKYAHIGVVMSGPFTKAQFAKVQKATKVRWGRIKKAIIWLKANNKLYADIDFDVDAIG